MAPQRMIDFIRRLFGLSERSPYGAYAPLVAASLAASRACFHSYVLRQETLVLDPQTASLEDCLRAYRDCLACIRTEYPETEEGSGAAFDLMPRIEAAILERFQTPPTKES